MPPMAMASSRDKGPSPISPTSNQRMTKAAFFRARSPPVPEKDNHNQNSIPVGNDLAGRFDLSTRIQDDYPRTSTREPDSSVESAMQGSGPGNGRFMGMRNNNNNINNGYASSVGTLGHTPPLENGSRLARNPTMSSDGPLSPRVGGNGNMATVQGPFGASNTGSDGTAYDEEEYDATKESSMTGITGGGSDEMLMSLLAGQAALDCETLPISRWEEVESWKKELSLMSNRLSLLVSRHQREVKILTAARTLQKLNNSNKRMSKQTMESLEQSEKRVEAAEKEVLVLREREAGLRRQLMEHWSGVMAWEVRRLEKVSSEAQARYARQQRQANTYKDREEAMRRQFTELEQDLQHRTGRVAQLEEVVVEMGQRERVIEDEIKQLDEERGILEKERQGWSGERQSFAQERSSWERERKAFEAEKKQWETERRSLMEERDQALRDQRQKSVESGRMSDRDRATMDKMRSGLGGILGRKSGNVNEAEMVEAFEEVKKLVERREKEVCTLRDEMREVNSGLEEEVRRVRADRDAWKSKVERAEGGKKEEVGQLEKKLRQHADQISDLSLRNESLSSSLQAAQAALQSTSTSAKSTDALQNQIDALTRELQSIATQFDSVYSLLPPPQKRREADLLDPNGRSNNGLVSPNRSLNFTALQQLYVPTTEKFSGMDEMVSRIRGMAEDGRVLVERVIRCDKEREVHKQNALKAKKLVEDSRHSLETYQQQVAVLEDRLAKSGSTESHFLDELNDLRSALEATSMAKKQAEAQVAHSTEACTRLTEANDSLSARALTLAEEAEQEKKALRDRLQDEIDALRIRLRESEEDADEQKMRGQSQRIQLLDELNSLQAEVGDLRKQLRAAQR